MTTAKLPAPPHWRNRPVRLLIGLLGCLGVAVAFTVVAVHAAERGHGMAIVVAALAAAAFLNLVVVAALARLGVIGAGRVHGPTGTVLTPRPTRVWFMVAVALLTIASGLYLVDRSELAVDFEALRGRTVRIAVVFGGCLIGLLVMLRGVGRGVGRLTLSPNHVGLVDYRGRERSVPWDGIADIADEAPRGKAHQPITITCTHEGPLVIQSAANYCDRGAALYWMLRHYWLTPASRAELSTDVALDRLAHNRFTPM